VDSKRGKKVSKAIIPKEPYLSNVNLIDGMKTTAYKPKSSKEIHQELCEEE
jgi:hypothetical protein